MDSTPSASPCRDRHDFLPPRRSTNALFDYHRRWPEFRTVGRLHFDPSLIRPPTIETGVSEIVFRVRPAMSRVMLLPLGVGEAFTARYYTSSFVLGFDDEWLLIDCSHPVRKMLREASIAARLPELLDLDRVRAVVVSHLHADHCCGLEDFGYYSFFALGRRANLLMHPDASAGLGWTASRGNGARTSEARRAAGSETARRLFQSR